MSATTHNVDPDEIHKFEKLAARWWDPESEFKPLHDINPLRVDYIDRRAACRLSRPRCRLRRRHAHRGHGAAGATVTGIDMGEAPLIVARLHRHESGSKSITARPPQSNWPKNSRNSFDVVTCLEMLEHVPDPAIGHRSLRTLLVKPGGQVFFSTINRNPKSYLFAVIGAEYVLGLLPKGTHEYRKFIRPSELERWARAADLAIRELAGMSYNPLTRTLQSGTRRGRQLSRLVRTPLNP